MTAPNLDGRRFRVETAAADGDWSAGTVFIFTQRDHIVWAPYAGGTISHGHLLAVMDPLGNLDARWHHVTVDGRIASGSCRCMHSRGPDGRSAYDGPFRIVEIIGSIR